jgi:hypothetical protein
MYPIIVIILVELNRSIDTTFSSFGTVTDLRGDRSSQVQPVPVTFAPRPVPPATGDQVDSGTKDAESRVTFDHTLELGDTPGMGAGSSKFSKLEEEHGDSYLSTVTVTSLA